MTTRRDLLATIAAAGAVSLAAGARSSGAASRSAFPRGFLWGAATAGHQVEGNNTASDLWLLEHLKPTPFVEPSGDACDHYYRYSEDIRLLAALGLNCYRFSLEWPRIEPEQGEYSRAEIEHYRRVLGCCHEHGITPFVTLSHFSAPRWFAARGGWEREAAAGHFARFAERVGRDLGDLIGGASTFNEPNVIRMLNWNPQIAATDAESVALLAAAARAVDVERFSSFMFAEPESVEPTMMAAHRQAFAALKAGRGRYPVGLSLSIQDDQPVGPASACDRKRSEVYGPWLELVASCGDFVGVQTYTRTRVGATADLGPEPGVELTMMGYEFWPEALEQTIRYAARESGKPVYVTENGIGTLDDERRIVYIRRALDGLRHCLADGVDVRGYMHWSLIDNFEWTDGFRPHFGLVAVDRDTFVRTPKRSAHYLGDIARRNAP